MSSQSAQARTAAGGREAAPIRPRRRLGFCARGRRSSVPAMSAFRRSRSSSMPGRPVVLVDVLPERVAAIHRGESHIEECRRKLVRAARAGGLSATTDYDVLRTGRRDLIALPTPLTPQREPDLDRASARPRDRQARSGRVSSSCSSRRRIRARPAIELLPILEESGLARRRGLLPRVLAERVDPGRIDYTTADGRRRSSAASRGLHRRVPRRCTSGASTTWSPGLDARGGRADQAAREHLPLGQHRAGQRAGDALRPDGHRHLGGDRRGRDQAVRLHALLPGPGLGGHCIPIDPFYLTWKAREYDFSTEFIELAGEINRQMPYSAVDQLAAALNDARQALKGSKVARCSASPTRRTWTTCARRRR